MSGSEDEERDQLGAIADFCKPRDTSHVPRELHFDHHAAPMDDDCWKSQAVVDQDMMEQPDERVSWIHFVDGVPYGERLLSAAEKGCTGLLLELVQEHPEVINHKDTDGYTPLHRACYQGYTDIVEILIDHGADVNSRTNDDWTPLHSASRWNKVECAERLIAAGCDVNAMSTGLQTPLHIASSSQACASVIHLLLWHPDTDTTILNSNNETAEKVALSNSVMGPLFELKHKFVDVNPLIPLPS